MIKKGYFINESSNGFLKKNNKTKQYYIINKYKNSFLGFWGEIQLQKSSNYTRKKHYTWKTNIVHELELVQTRNSFTSRL